MAEGFNFGQNGAQNQMDHKKVSRVEPLSPENNTRNRKAGKHTSPTNNIFVNFEYLNQKKSFKYETPCLL